MASIQDVVNAAYRIETDATDLADRMLRSAEDLRIKNDELLRTIRGSRSGQDAVRQVSEATQVLRNSVAQLRTLKSDIQRFTTDLTK
ncbi:hypothetical protein [Raineyella sp. W15-4]|uniref:hypothetical protein n=1 Tax=Raineyella sp. W15-4 TaxID=3081651 RepID=UPI0029538ED3|nr:hypothetical protein [Raineyella sp. W15-4]WOQ16719.1 hypothetical protein R0145_16160 [Raineyella sp. W15-4]